LARGLDVEAETPRGVWLVLPPNHAGLPSFETTQRARGGGNLLSALGAAAERGQVALQGCARGASDARGRGKVALHLFPGRLPSRARRTLACVPTGLPGRAPSRALAWLDRRRALVWLGDRRGGQSDKGKERGKAEVLTDGTRATEVEGERDGPRGSDGPLVPRVGLTVRQKKENRPTAPSYSLVFKLLGLNIGLNRSLNLISHQIQTSLK
jgi:hypothetical protein